MANLNAKAIKKSETVPTGAEVVVTLPGKNQLYSVDKADFLSETGVTNLTSDSYTYTEVAVTAAQIKSMGTTPVELLAAPGANSYYEYKGLIEYTYDTATYTFSGDAVLVAGENSWAGTSIINNFLTQAKNLVAEFGTTAQEVIDPANEDNPVTYAKELNEAVILTTFNSGDPTGASAAGTFLVKIWYKTKTFGTEL